MTHSPKLSDADIPVRMRKLPRDRAGRVVPWFVAWFDGQPDFRVVRPHGIRDAVRFRTCWLCGGPLGANAAFVIGPMCAVNRTSAEPPSHRDCAIYAAKACPFLTTPRMRRRDGNLPDGVIAPDGVMITRNPGVALIWITRGWSLMPAYQLFELGPPTEALWFAEGRPATRAEVLAPINSGMPILRAEAEKDPRPAEALAELENQHRDALRHIPGGDR